MKKLFIIIFLLFSSNCYSQEENNIVIKYIGPEAELPTNEIFLKYNENHPLLRAKKEDFLNLMVSPYSRVRLVVRPGHEAEQYLIAIPQLQKFYARADSLYRLKSGANKGKYLGANLLDFSGQPYLVSQKYIATEAPFQTADDYYRMVLDQNARILVSLTSLKEEPGKGFDKIYFWRNGEKEKNNPVTLHHLPINSNLSIDNDLIESIGEEFFIFPVSLSKVTVKHYKVKKHNGQIYEIRHIIYKDWTDDAQTKEARDLVSLVRLIELQEQALKTTNLEPIVINCNGGVGRTGILIAIDLTYKTIAPTLEKILLSKNDAEKIAALKGLEAKLLFDPDSIINAIQHFILIGAAVGHREKLVNFPANLIDVMVGEVGNKPVS